MEFYTPDLRLLRVAVIAGLTYAYAALDADTGFWGVVAVGTERLKHDSGIRIMWDSDTRTWMRP